IKSIKVSITGSYMNTITDTFAFDPQHPDVTRTYQVPTGIDRKFHIDALDTNDKAIYTGETVLDVKTDTSSVAVDLYPSGAIGQSAVSLSIPNVPRSLGHLPGVNISVYLDGQDPNADSQITEQQMRDRLAIIWPWAGPSVRNFSATDGNEFFARVAHALGG